MFALFRHRTSSTGESKSTEDWISCCLCLNKKLLTLVARLADLGNLTWDHVGPVNSDIHFLFFLRAEHFGQDEMPLLQAHIKKMPGNLF